LEDGAPSSIDVTTDVDDGEGKASPRRRFGSRRPRIEAKTRARTRSHAELEDWLVAVDELLAQVRGEEMPEGATVPR
jgi:hypothetical protein